MDPNFTFPRPQPPLARVRPVAESESIAPTSRESNALRASVLDAALLLGVGSNNIVTDWMFSNSLEEVDEENTISPALTYASTATSNESFNTPSANISAGAYRVESKLSSACPPQQQDHYATLEKAINSDSTLILSGDKETNIPPQPTSTEEKSGRNKLKKRRTDGYGTEYESEGYTSESAVVRKKTEKKKKKEKVKEGKLADAEKKMKAKEEKERAKEERKADKKLGIRNAVGYETDGGYLSEAPELSKFRISRSKSKSPMPNVKSLEHSYETDSGYVSSSSKQKRSFFRLTSKSSKTDLTPTQSKKVDRHDVPPIPSMPLPIAEMFSSTCGGSAMGSRIGTPAPSLASGTPRSIPSAVLSPTTPNAFFTGLDISSTPGSALPLTTSIYSSISGNSLHSTLVSQDLDEINKGERLRRKGSKLIESESESGSSNGHGRMLARSKSQRPHPTISLPLTRPLSPPAPNSRPTQSTHLLSPSLNAGQANSPTGSSSPLSPFVLVTPVGTSPSKPVDQVNTYSTRVASQLSVIPSANYIVPSPSSSPPLPSVLAYYDIPPPSPPPSGPLPRPPSSSLGRSRSPNSPVHVPNATSPLVPHEPTLFSQTIMTSQRGREAPFPTRPILPQVSTKSTVSPGFEARLRVRRYRDLHTIASPEKTGTSSEAHADLSNSESDDEADMRDLLDRFVDEYGDHGDGKAVPTRRSFEDLRDVNDGEVDDDDKSTYPHEYAARTTRDRAMFSARSISPSPSPSVYSHGSILMEGDRRSHGSFWDGERSEAARERFVQRVEAMYDETGREKTSVAVPPVPKLPAGVVNQRWGRF